MGGGTSKWQNQTERVEWIRAIPCFSGLSHPELVRLAAIFRVHRCALLARTACACDCAGVQRHADRRFAGRRRYQVGEDLITQGGVGDTFFSLMDGSVQVIAMGPEGLPVLLCEQRAGYYFGEVRTVVTRTHGMHALRRAWQMALLKDTVRVATVRASSPCVALVLSRDQFKRHIDAAISMGAGGLHGSGVVLHTTRLNTIPFIAQVRHCAAAGAMLPPTLPPTLLPPLPLPPPLPPPPRLTARRTDGQRVAAVDEGGAAAGRLGPAGQLV